MLFLKMSNHFNRSKNKDRGNINELSVCDSIKKNGSVKGEFIDKLHELSKFDAKQISNAQSMDKARSDLVIAIKNCKILEGKLKITLSDKIKGVFNFSKKVEKLNEISRVRAYAENRLEYMSKNDFINFGVKSK
ncbi:hypothetical protein [Burkholderia pyrrocinia]